MGIQARERDTYESIWSGVSAYAEHSPGAEFVPVFLAEFSPKAGASVLDAGCGSGKGGLALAEAGLSVTLFDLTNAGLVPEAADLPFREGSLWHPLPLRRVHADRAWAYLHHPGIPYDYVYCADVLEHIPPQFTALVLARLLDAAKAGVFLSISTVPDQFGVYIGKPLHQTVQSFVWWKQTIEAVGAEILDARDCLTTALFCLRGGAK